MDRLLLILGEPYEIANYDFRRRSEWQKQPVAVIEESSNPCKLEGCNRPIHAKKMCHRHYRQCRRSVSSASLG